MTNHLNRTLTICAGSGVLLANVLTASCEGPPTPHTSAPATDLAATTAAATEPTKPGKLPDPQACSHMKGDPRFDVGSWKFREFADENGDDWGCVPQYVQLGPHGAPLENNLAYYLMGTGAGPRRAKLTLNVNVPADKTVALEQLTQSARLLTRAALALDLPAEAEQAIARGKDRSLIVAGREVSISRKAFAPTGIKGGFSQRYVISLE